MSSFATLVLLGGVCASAHWADLIEQKDVVVHYEHPYHNALDEAARAMLVKNVEYAEDKIQHSMPLYHVVHEDESQRYLKLNQEQETSSSSESSESSESEESDSSEYTDSSESDQMANEITASDRAEESSSDFATDSSLGESSDASSADSSESESQAEAALQKDKATKEAKGENTVPIAPFKPKAEWKQVDEDIDLSSSASSTSSEDEDSSSSSSNLDTSSSDSDDEVKEAKERAFETQKHEADQPVKPKMPDLPPKVRREKFTPPNPKKKYQKPKVDHQEDEKPFDLYIPADEESLAQDIEDQLRDILDVPGTEHEVNSVSDDLPASAIDAELQQERKYDLNKFSEADLEALKEIRSRASPVKDRQNIREQLEKQDVKSLPDSIDYAEQKLRDRLRRNLDMYHDLKKLRGKSHGDFTTQDLKFVKDTVCPDGNCFSGAINMTTLLSVAIALTVSWF